MLDFTKETQPIQWMNDEQTRGIRVSIRGQMKQVAIYRLVDVTGDLNMKENATRQVLPPSGFQLPIRNR